MFSDKIMRNELDDLPDEELASVLVTPDGRGTINKQKALDILLRRAHDKGMIGREKVLRAAFKAHPEHFTA